MEAVSFIKENITEAMVTDYLIQNGANGFRPDGDKYRCACPIHKGSNETSFVYNPDGHLWVCHSECGGGDIFTLIAYMNDLDIEKDFAKVVVITAKQFGLDINDMVVGDISTSYKSDMVKWCQYELKRKEIYNSPYDLSRLGSRFKLNSYRGMDKELLDKFGVFYAQDFNRILFTINNENSEVIGASLRAVKDEKPKWLHQPKSLKTGEVLYNLDNIKGKYKEVYIVEGMMDCINLYILGVENVVCTFGSRITRRQLFLLMNNFEKIILLFDNDVAGKKANKQCIKDYHKIINMEVMLLKEFNDPGELKSIDDFNNIEKVKWYDYVDS